VQHNSLEKDLEKFLLFQKIFRYQITFYSMLNSLNSLYFVKKIFSALGHREISPKAQNLDIAKNRSKNNFRNFFPIFYDQNTYGAAITTVRTSLCNTSNFHLWRSAKVAKIGHGQKCLEK
jgi:hypothetical protein